MPPTAKRWRLAPPAAATDLSRSLHVSSVVAHLLANRGVTDPAAGREFLDGGLGLLPPPAALPGVPAAADLVARAAAAGDRICVYGDYDVDGTTGTAVLYGLLTLAGAAAEFYIPDRREEGYGLNAAAVRGLAASGVKLIVTVDCGATAVAEADVAAAAGVTLVVTDHHEFKADIPRAAAVAHPRLPGGAYPNPHLCGAGVAFKLAWAVAQRLSGRDKVDARYAAYLHDALGLVALGVVADVVPLVGENRLIVRHGLRRLAEAPSVGLRMLLEVAGLKDKPVTAEAVGYQVGPRVNAAGRLEGARQVVELFTTTNPVRARELAERLEELNAHRQGVERKVTAEAKELVDSEGYAGDPAIVVAGAGWNQGVVGIVASRIVGAFGKPALVVGFSADDPARPGAGSGRSVAGFPLHLALSACGAHLESHGGHAAAAGFKVRPENLAALRAAFAGYAAGFFPDGVPPPELVADAEIPLAAVTLGLLSDLDRLEPYGCGNARPLFLAAGLTVETPRRIGGDQRHLDFRVRQGGTTVRAVAWGMGDRLDELMADDQCSLMFTPKLNEWNGQRKVEIEVQDFRSGADPRLGE